jgi:type II secretory ATPase GspE/PulE/Tfp pilus assembly ATPase PilB-like protein
MNIEPFLLASTVNVILAQRLVRKICKVCRTNVTIKRGELKKNIPDPVWKKYFGKKTEINVFKGKGCKVCNNTGYIGRVGIFEVMEISEKIRALIMTRKDAKTITNEAIAEGMTPLLDDGIKKVMDGTTTIHEVLRVIKIEKI